MRAFGAVFTTGIVGLIVAKLLEAMMVPLAGMLVAFIALALKVGFFIGVGLFALWLFRRMRREAAA